jgi:asparagine synthase (glutamine-hydrolysing)
VSQKNIYKRQFYQLAQKNRHMHAYISIYDKYERNKLFTDLVTCGINKQAEAFKTCILDSLGADNQTNAQALDMMTYMNDDVLCKVDRASMHHSLEVRVPLLDHKFVELAFQIPHHLKLHKGNLKYILKKAMTPHLASEILSHKKQGFAVPMKNWLTHAMQKKVHSKLLDPSNQIYDYLDKDYVRRVIYNNETSKRKLERHVWTIFMFSEWLNSKRANV